MSTQIVIPNTALYRARTDYSSRSTTYRGPEQ